MASKVSTEEETADELSYDNCDDEGSDDDRGDNGDDGQNQQLADDSLRKKQRDVNIVKIVSAVKGIGGGVLSVVGGAFLFTPLAPIGLGLSVGGAALLGASGVLDVGATIANWVKGKEFYVEFQTRAQRANIW